MFEYSFNALNNYFCKFKHKNITVQIYWVFFIDKDKKI